MTPQDNSSALKVSVGLGMVRRGHGLALEIELEPRGYKAGTNSRVISRTVSSQKLELDFAGDIYAAFPPGAKALASWVLPLSVHGDVAPSKNSCITLKFTLGARKLSHATLLSYLDKLVAAGDPPFCMDLLADHQLLCRLCVTGGSIVGALRACPPDHSGNFRKFPSTTPVPLVASPPPALLQEAEARRKPSSLRNALLLLRWWLLPLLFTAVCSGLAVAPEWTSQLCSVLPRVIHLNGPGKRERLADVLPAVPTTLLQSFRLGRLLEAYESTKDAAKLQLAANLLQRPTLTAADVAGVEVRLRELEDDVGLVSRMYGFFSFVNIIWLCAILGIALSLGPSLLVLLKPIKDFLKRVATNVWQHIVKPTIRQLHDRGLFELGAWLLCCTFILDAHNHYSQDVGRHMAITGLALSCLALAYSTLRHGGKIKSNDPHGLHRLVSMWLALTAGALASLYDSDLLGYAAVLALYSCIGFHVASYGLCIAVGFADDNALDRCLITSFLLLCGMISSRLSLSLSDPSQSTFLATPRAVLRPFRSAASVMGSVVLFLALLIQASRYYTPHRALARPAPKLGYLGRNVLCIAGLLSFLFWGLLLGLPGVANTATVFLVLYLADKYAEFHVDNNWSGWVLVLFLSIATWRAALWLHANPGTIASLFEVL